MPSAYFSGGVEAAPAGATTTGALVTRNSGLDFCTVWYTPQPRGRITTNQYTTANT